MPLKSCQSWGFHEAKAHLVHAALDDRALRGGKDFAGSHAHQRGIRRSITGYIGHIQHTYQVLLVVLEWLDGLRLERFADSRWAAGQENHERYAV